MKTHFRSILFSATLAALLVGCASSPLTSDQRQAHYQSLVNQTVGDKADRKGASLLVHSDKLGIHHLVRYQASGPEAYHIASIGKTFTAVLLGQLVDQGKLSLDAPVAPLLAPGTLDGLFVAAGVDHQAEVTVAQLLGHTSGIADYFADSPSSGPAVSHQIVDDPAHRWTPAELLAFTRDRLQAVGKPGAQYHYSDSGYIVLGLVVEAVAGAPFHQVLAQNLLEPLGMTKTFMPFVSEPLSGGDRTLRPAWLHGKDVSALVSVTADWAGGGIASTEEDLLKFQTALRAGKLVSAATLARFDTFAHPFQSGIHYGLGMMQLRFGEFFFLLDGLPKMTGHMGVLGTMMFYDPTRDLHIIVNLGTDQGMEDAVKIIIEVLTTV